MSEKELLIDINELEKLYIREKKSISQLTKIFNCSRSTIERRLKENNIVASSRDQYKFYTDKNTLIDLYITQQKSIIEISEEYHVSPITISKWLKIFNISIEINKQRSYNRDPISDKIREEKRLLKIEKSKLPKKLPHIMNEEDYNSSFKELLYGHMLGDGQITKTSNSSIHFSMSSKHEDYIKYVKHNLEKYNIIGSENVRKLVKDNKYTWYRWDSYSYRGCITEQYDIWYNTNSKLPLDLIITPILMRTFYIDDGYLNLNKGYLKGVAFSTENFVLKDVNKLASMIEKAINIKTVVYKKENGYIIRINRVADVKTFFSYIGDCPGEIIHCFGYKWPDYNAIKGRHDKEREVQNAKI